MATYRFVQQTDFKKVGQVQGLGQQATLFGVIKNALSQAMHMWNIKALWQRVENLLANVCLTQTDKQKDRAKLYAPNHRLWGHKTQWQVKGSECSLSIVLPLPNSESRNLLLDPCSFHVAKYIFYFTSRFLFKLHVLQLLFYINAKLNMFSTAYDPKGILFEPSGLGGVGYDTEIYTQLDIFAAVHCTCP